MKFLSANPDRILRNVALFFLLILTLIHPVKAQKPIYVPDRPYAWVNDFTDLLSDQDEVYLNKKLSGYEDTTSTQIYVVTLNGQNLLPIDEMAFEIAETWKIGGLNKDNGLLILIYPETREINIQTGYGLEAFIPDAIAKRIIEQEIKPSFREENYLKGLDKATDVIFKLLSGQFTAEQYVSGTGPDAIFFLIFLVLMIALIAGGISRKGKSSASFGKNLPLWIALSMLSSGRGSHKGSWGGFSSGRGGGFGGFSGGGGGRFGGGGASGSW
jgi:uncharacterized protein